MITYGNFVASHFKAPQDILKHLGIDPKVEQSEDFDKLLLALTNITNHYEEMRFTTISIPNIMEEHWFWDNEYTDSLNLMETIASLVQHYIGLNVMLGESGVSSQDNAVRGRGLNVTTLDIV